jgi:hypothetical protein
MKIRFSRAAPDFDAAGFLSTTSTNIGCNRLRVLVFRAFFPAALLTWLFFFAYAQRSQAAANQAQPDKAVDRAMLRSMDSMDHLVVVAGHSVMRLNRLQSATYDESSWYLLSYQLGQGFPGIITSHVKKGIEIARDDPGALLVFSGGQTRVDVGPTSEAASYYYLAEQNGWLNDAGGALRRRVFLEEYARDSYENLLFAICR